MPLYLIMSFDGKGRKGDDKKNSTGILYFLLHIILPMIPLIMSTIVDNAVESLEVNKNMFCFQKTASYHQVSQYMDIVLYTRIPAFTNIRYKVHNTHR